MGLPGAGKTTLAQTLVKKLESKNKSVTWFNADQVRKDNNDWDFSDSGRIRQASRMYKLAKQANTDYVICDFVCPTPLLRAIFMPDFLVWVDTINESQYEDTNSAFTPPSEISLRVLEQDAEKYSDEIINLLF